MEIVLASEARSSLLPVTEKPTPEILSWNYRGKNNVSHHLELTFLVIEDQKHLEQIKLDGTILTVGREIRKMLSVLAERRGSVVTTDVILSRMYSHTTEERHFKIVTVFLCGLRNKQKSKHFSLDAPGETLFTQVWGRGIMMCLADGESSSQEQPAPPAKREQHCKGPDGEWLTLATLPERNFKRWGRLAKVALVFGVRGNLLSAEEACYYYKMHPDELARWDRLFEEHGPLALRINQVHVHK